MKHTPSIPLFTLVLASTGVLSAMDADSPIIIGSRRELFVDDALVERLGGKADFRLQHPTPREVVIVHDAPWEGNNSTYHCVFQDGDLYRMFYVTGHLAAKNDQLDSRMESFCYAESDDGIHWRKPELGLHEFQGSKANNIILSRAMAQGHDARIGAPAVFKDGNPRADLDARYKMFLSSERPLGMLPMKSPDGIHWTPMSKSPVITAGAFDAMNLAFWDSERSEYRAYWRYFTAGVTTGEQWEPAGVRAIRTATSNDLMHWERQSNLNYPGSPEEQLYENGIHPYYRAPHLLIGLPVRYVDRANPKYTTPAVGNGRAGLERIREWPASLRSLPDFGERQERAALIERLGSALTEGLFMSSRDGVSFRRWNEAFLRPGIERPGTWNYGQQFVCWQLVETNSALDGAPRELSLYATEGGWLDQGKSLRRYTLRLDGFVSLNAPMSGGELLTKPIQFHGNTLSLNFSTSAAGGVRVELRDARDEPIPGFTLNDCDDLFGDAIDRRVTWNTNADLSAIARQTVRIRFVLRDADLYSFQFGDSP
ncbi:MAG: hypothetical protein FJ295_04270 [Planctomycetes bacterium]|nr:hypothetical protein [Planctomycetota bacterium]